MRVHSRRTVNRPRATQRQFISFFSGAQGLDIGLERAGLKCLAATDFDSAACATLRQNTPSLRVYETDIRNLDASTLRSDLQIAPEELFAIVGGPPCQAFSTAGRRLGLNDERGNVFLHFIDLITQLRPQYAVFENVRGLLSAPLSHRPHDQRGPGFPPLNDEERPGGALLHILGLLEQAGYATTFTLYNVANFGVPQSRERLIFFASRSGRKVPLMSPTHDEFGAGGLPKWVTLRDALGRMQSGKHHFHQFPEKRLQYYKLLREGQNWRDLPIAVQKEAMGESWFSPGGRTGFYRRLAWDKPSPTLVTRPTMKATDLCHPEELRPLSVEEYAAIQTFPPDYWFAGTMDDQYRQIGNAVPCVFGETIGRHITAFDEGRLTTEKTPVRHSRYERTDHNSWRETMAGLERQLSFL